MLLYPVPLGYTALGMDADNAIIIYASISSPTSASSPVSRKRVAAPVGGIILWDNDNNEILWDNETEIAFDK